ncbi:MAG TPA: putative peptide modification system cyclase, partial [Xanthomonadaceae bacterium]|nr:putative peptide modification system cyclase [Xanthomonadaceae bacterium]
MKRLGGGAPPLSGRPQPVIAFAERDWVVVGDLRNLTGDPGLTEALDVAFRISLEQSRHVNVLSDLKVRDTLSRMQREPGTPLDRETGAEIAVREGARALILPSVAEVGGRVRISAEVVDPTTLTTVYAESHDGVGVESTLRSMDRVTGALRARLGEALQGIESDSQPLPQVSTGSMDALRAYAEGLGYLGQTRFKQAEAAFSRALEIDPEFALAYIGRARTHAGADDIDAAHAQMMEARARSERLGGRDRLYVDAWAASFGPLEDALQAWRLLASLYPDDFAAHYNIGWLAWSQGRVDQAARQSALRAADPKNPFKDAAHSMAGVLSMLLGDVEGALEQFQSMTPGAPPLLASRHAMALYAAGRGNAAREILEAAAPAPEAALEPYWHLAGITMDWADGNSVQARRHLEQVAARAAAAGGHEHRRMMLASHMLDRFEGVADAGRTRLLCEEMSSALRSALRNGSSGHLVGAALCAYLLASFDPDVARDLLTLIEELARPGFPIQQSSQAVAAAELARVSGNPDEAVALLQPLAEKPALLLV